MTDPTSIMGLEAIRLAARTANYPNTETERANIARVDGEVFDRVRTHERHLLENANAFMHENTAELQAAASFSNALDEDVIYALDSRDADAGAIADRFEKLRSGIMLSISTLERLAQQADWHAAKVDDPYGNYLALVSKYSTLKPSISVQ
jgi:hypothetical protein